MPKPGAFFLHVYFLAGAWSENAVYIPKPGAPHMRSAPELSSADVGHVCVEWEAADSNGMVLYYLSHMLYVYRYVP